MRIDVALRAGTDQLRETSSSARLDAEILLAHCLKKNRNYLYTWPEKQLTPRQSETFEATLLQRAELYPIAYITGYQEFWSLKLNVTPDVLIPRADTELLVETALEKIQHQAHPTILDLGTGSGAIAFALATERPDSKIIATDSSSAALIIAEENRKALGIENIQFIKSDWFSDVPLKQFDLVVSNPPYIDPDDTHLKREIRHEPLQALISENNGLADLEQIIKNAPQFLKEQSWLIVEHGYDQGKIVSALLNEAAYEDVSCLSDFSGNDRINLGLKPNQPNPNTP